MVTHGNLLKILGVWMLVPINTAVSISVFCLEAHLSVITMEIAESKNISFSEYVSCECSLVSSIFLGLGRRGCQMKTGRGNVLLLRG